MKKTRDGRSDIIDVCRVIPLSAGPIYNSAYL